MRHACRNMKKTAHGNIKHGRAKSISRCRLKSVLNLARLANVQCLWSGVAKLGMGRLPLREVVVIYHLFENAKQIRVEALEVRNHGVMWSSHRREDVFDNL